MTTYELTVTSNGRQIDGFTITTDRTPTRRRLTRIVDDLREVTAGMIPGEISDPDQNPTYKIHRFEETTR